MKKTFLCIVFIVSAIALQGQGLYLGSSIGYGLKTSMYSYGAGFVPTLSVGYIFKKPVSDKYRIGAELGMGYFIGSNNRNGDGYKYSYNVKYSAQSFYLNPSFILQIGNRKVVVYEKLGFFLGLANKSVYESKYYYAYNSYADQTTITKGGASIGVTTAFGVEVKLSNKISVSGDLFGRFVRWTPTTWTPFSYRISLSAVGMNIGVKYYLSKK